MNVLVGVDVGVLVGVDVKVGLLVRVNVSVELEVVVLVFQGVTVGLLNIAVRVFVADNEVGVSIVVEATSKAAPTMIKFTELAAIRIAIVIRRAMILMQILFFHCMDRSYSSSLGHSSMGQ